MGFQPGNTHGKGRPKGTQLNEVCKAFADAEGIPRLIEWAKGGFRNAHGQLQAAGWSQPKDGKGKPIGALRWAGPSYELQFEALKLALAYGLGKPRNPVDLTSDGETLFGFLRGIPVPSTNGHSNGNGNGNGVHP